MENTREHKNLLPEGHEPGFVPTEITEDQWVLGGVNAIAGVPLTDGHWYKAGHVPDGEKQGNPFIDTQNCTPLEAAEKIEEAKLETKKAQYLYHNNDDYFFMDAASFEQFSLSEKQLGKTAGFLKEGAQVDILYFDGQPINLNLPIKISLEITYTEPGFRGNTAANVFKSATLETGAQIQVPLFIKTGDKVVVDSRTGEYINRI